MGIAAAAEAEEAETGVAEAARGALGGTEDLGTTTAAEAAEAELATLGGDEDLGRTAVAGAAEADFVLTSNI